MIEPLLEVRGVRYAALIGPNGEIVTRGGPQIGEQPDSSLTDLVSAGQAVGRSLTGAINAASWNELLLDVDGGPVLLTTHGDQVLVTAFDDVANLGRVRFALRRVLGAG